MLSLSRPSFSSLVEIIDADDDDESRCYLTLELSIIFPICVRYLPYTTNCGPCFLYQRLM